MKNDKDIVATRVAKNATRARGKPRTRDNPVETFVRCFDSVRAAAEAAGVSTEMLRRMRLRGYVSTRKRALRMAQACQHRVRADELLALPQAGAP